MSRPSVQGYYVAMPVRALWPAAHALRQAERLADLRLVEGPQDAPPASVADVPGWLDDWVERASETLDEGWRMVRAGAADAAGPLLDRAREIGARIEAGARSALGYVRQSGVKVAKRARAGLEEVARTAGQLVAEASTGIMSSPGGLLLLAIGLYLLTRR